MKLAGISRAEMAEYLGVGQSTVTTWTSDRITPSVQTLRLWALRTGVPFEWLKTGKIPHPDGGPEEGLSAKLPHLDSNQKPAD
ncbi:helix-turn-helix domain-containing protein [Nocardia vaccinii]|uniref:helix-turn-helix domain-containing protein n=1 Tax=Nocardia vaccinii TaxID=1822 RepID=UPI0024806940|nr:helix-turn-helix transcriptional regulator [Nocardia vaccinii]